jgi:SAM-dependent methyltransferase
MSSFAGSTYNTVKYAAARPTYPKQLFDFIFKFHERSKDVKWNTAVDLGCGTGQATAEFARFQRVIGLDPSEKMVAGAREYVKSLGLTNCSFFKSSAETLTDIEDGSVDLVIAAQAGHWFDWSKVWPETARVLTKGGSAGFWAYSEFRLPDFPALNPMITHHFQNQQADPTTSLGPHFERPGRTILENHLIAVPDANAVVPGAFEATERVYFTGDYYPSLPSEYTQPVIIRKQMAWNNLLGYLNTASAYHTYLNKYPEDAANPEGDVNLRFWKKLKGDADGEDAVNVDWPLALILTKRA